MTEQPPTLVNLQQQVNLKKQGLNNLNAKIIKQQEDKDTFYTRKAEAGELRKSRQELQRKLDSIQSLVAERKKLQREYEKDLKARNQEQSRQQKQQKGPKRSRVRRTHKLTPHEIKNKKIIPSFILCELNPIKNDVQKIKDYRLTIPTFHSVLNVEINFERQTDDRGGNSLAAKFKRTSLNNNLNPNATTQAKVFESLGGNLNKYYKNNPFLFTTPQGHLPKPPGVSALDELFGELLEKFEVSTGPDIFTSSVTKQHNQFFYYVR